MKHAHFDNIALNAIEGSSFFRTEVNCSDFCSIENGVWPFIDSMEWLYSTNAI